MLKLSSSSVFWLSILFGIPLYLWLWSVGTKLPFTNQKGNELRRVIFNMSVFYPIAYSVLESITSFRVVIL